MRYADASIHEACREALLLLRDFLVQASRPHLVDLTCSMIGRALGQQEYMLRSSRVALWSWPAVRHMDALVQLYTELMRQVSCLEPAVMPLMQWTSVLLFIHHEHGARSTLNQT